MFFVVVSSKGGLIEDFEIIIEEVDIEDEEIEVDEEVLDVVGLVEG